MTPRSRSLAAGVTGLALLAALGTWLHATSPDGTFPAVPGAGDLAPRPDRPADAGPATAPAPFAAAAPPASPVPAAAAVGDPAAPLPLPDPVAAPVQGPPPGRSLEALAPAGDSPGRRLDRLRRSAQADPSAPLPWVDLGREWVRQGRTDLGRTAFRRAWGRARDDADRMVIRRTWEESGLPPEELKAEAFPARRRPAR